MVIENTSVEYYLNDYGISALVREDNQAFITAYLDSDTEVELAVDDIADIPGGFENMDMGLLLKLKSLLRI